jgi:hypothetical protein
VHRQAEKSLFKLYRQKEARWSPNTFIYMCYKQATPLESIICWLQLCKSFLFIEKVMEFSGSIGASGFWYEKLWPVTQLFFLLRLLQLLFGAGRKLSPRWHLSSAMVQGNKAVFAGRCPSIFLNYVRLSKPLPFYNY